MKIAHIIFEKKQYNFSTQVDASENQIRNFFVGSVIPFGPKKNIYVKCVDCIVQDANSFKIRRTSYRKGSPNHFLHHLNEFNRIQDLKPFFHGEDLVDLNKELFSIKQILDAFEK